MCCESVFLKRLRERGLRLTPQREMILSALHDLDRHATAEEIYALVSKQSTAVDLSTVYRTLELLQQLHLVASLDLGDGQNHYELLGVHGQHHHLLCRKCRKLVRVEHEELQGLLEGLAAAHGFSAEPEHLVITGLCADCRAADKAA